MEIIRERMQLRKLNIYFWTLKKEEAGDERKWISEEAEEIKK